LLECHRPGSRLVVAEEVAVVEAASRLRTCSWLAQQAEEAEEAEEAAAEQAG